MEQTNDFWKLLINGTHIVPLEDKEGAIFVDAYCGIGEYAMDLANEFPSVKVIGIGREFNSPVSKPANCRFVVENVVEGTHIASNSCQFVQSRDTALWLREENWEPYFAELFRILAGNGYIQVLEMDVWRKYPSGEGAGFSQWCNVVYPALASTKGVCVYNLSQRLAEAAQTVGFTDISPLLYEIPVGHWEKRTWGPKFIEAGKRLRENLLRTVETKRALLFSIMMDRMETEISIASARGELYDDNFRALHHAVGFIARKPPNDNTKH